LKRQWQGGKVARWQDGKMAISFLFTKVKLFGGEKL